MNRFHNGTVQAQKFEVTPFFCLLNNAYNKSTLLIACSRPSPTCLLLLNTFVHFPSSIIKSNCISCPTNIWRSEEHTSELQSRFDLVCRLLLEKKKRGVT